jgi:hypothetical protein
MKKSLLVLLVFSFWSCQKTNNETDTFGYAAQFLNKYKQTIILTGSDSLQKILLCPGYQARVMTSTADGNKGLGFGWINFDFIAQQKTVPHINAYGGEDRIWYGPEGGQYALFFKDSAEFIFDNWQVPSIMDTDDYDLAEQTSSSVAFTKNISLKNYSGFTFNYKIERKISMLDNAAIQKLTGISDQVKAVGYQSENKVTNSDSIGWTKEKGLISIWIMGMFPVSDEATAIFPIKNIPSQTLKINDGYFKKPDVTRLRIEDSTVLFKADGKYRSKIGIDPMFAKNVIGSYDAVKQTLTLIFFNQPQATGLPYINSLWKQQPDPFAGEVTHSYNDGPNDDSKPDKGTFYELETSSPALELKQKESYLHVHQTIHIQGDKRELDKISQKILGISIGQL